MAPSFASAAPSRSSPTGPRSRPLSPPVAAPAAPNGPSVRVLVTASIKDTFSLTVRTSGLYDFGPRKPGKRYHSPRLPILRVVSTRPWILSDSSDALVTSIPGRVVPRRQLLRHVTNVRMNRPLRPGLYEIDARYWLDLTAPWVRDLPEGTEIKAYMGYTVVQL